MEKQMDNNTLTVDELVEEMGMGRTVFFNKLKSAVLEAGDRVVFNDTYILYLTKKPQGKGWMSWI